MSYVSRQSPKHIPDQEIESQTNQDVGLVQSHQYFIQVNQGKQWVKLDLKKKNEKIND